MNTSLNTSYLKSAWNSFVGDRPSLLNETDGNILAPTKSKPSSKLFDPFERIQSTKSQYSFSGSSSACTLLATEACLRLLSADSIQPRPTVEIIDSVLEAGADAQVNHLEFEQVLTSIDRFSKAFVKFPENQVPLSKLQTLANKLEQPPFALLLTKAPESIALICQTATRFIIFDSHKRPDTDGAYFAVCGSISTAISVIQGIWPPTDFSFDAGYQADLLNTIGYTMIKRNKTPLADLPQLHLCKISIADMKQTLVALEKTTDSQNRTISELCQRLAACQQELDRQRGGYAELKSAFGNSLSRFLNVQKEAVVNHEAAMAKLINQFDLTDLSKSMFPTPAVQIAPSPVSVGVEADVLNQRIPVLTPVQISLNEDYGSFQCLPCKKVLHSDEVFLMKTCNHKMCRNCARDHIGEMVTRKRYPITCPILKCGKRLDSDDITLVLDPSKLEMFERSGQSVRY